MSAVVSTAGPGTSRVTAASMPAAEVDRHAR
ncbi:MAG: hypothetical protein H6Q36_1209 [Chloroflexi bacterium]|nr:hypothetical protein [Chloroflexota bacterium]